jgi:hypothetical protein
MRLPVGRSPVTLAWIGGGAAGLLLGVLILAVVVTSRDPFDLPFDRSVWLAHANDMAPDNPRGHMTTSLIEHLQRSSPTRAAVIELLGPAEDPCSQLASPPSSVAGCLSYNLGMWSGFRMDYDSLDIYFDRKDRFVAALMIQH